MWENAAGGSRYENPLGVASQGPDVDPGQGQCGGMFADSTAHRAQPNGLGITADAGHIDPTQSGYRCPIGFGPTGTLALISRSISDC